ncbi:MAG TPA: VWA domain-containing protein, partial [Steroidobacteraceae bacterium]
VLRWSAQALLCRRAADQQRFGELFDAWFLPPNRRNYVESRTGGGSGALELGAARAGVDDHSDGTPAATADQSRATGSERGSTAQRGASEVESLAQADFRHLHQPHEMRQLEALMREFAFRLRKLTLRRESLGGALRIDIPGTARLSVSHGGEPIELAFRRRRQTPPRLILLLDVSRSMSLYSFFFLRLARALQAVRLDTAVFIWHTQLAGVSQALEDPDPWRAQERLQLLSAGWAGGTRIGDCLEQFEREHHGIVHSRTAIIVVSDGYDTGDPVRLAAAVRRLRRRARRFVWLNPLAANSDYQPLARSMQAVLPELDLFAPANNLASIERVLPSLVLALR